MDDLDAFLDAKPDDIDAFLDMKDAPAAPEGRDYSLFRSEFQSNQLPRGAGFDTMLSNKPVGLGGSIIRSSPASAAALIGGALGAPLGPLGVLGGSALGGFAAEITRQNAVQLSQMARGEDVTPARESISRATSEGVSQGAGAGLGLGVGGVVGSKFVRETVRPAVNRVGAGVLKIAAGVPENVGRQVMEDPSVLLGAPTRESVSALYDKYHKISRTMSRDEFISKSARPSDIGRVGFAIDEMDAAALALRDGTLTEQQAVNASQASRIISDARREGTEISQKMAEYAQDTKAAMDDFIGKGRAASQTSKRVLVAPEPETAPTSGHSHGPKPPPPNPVVDSRGNPLYMDKVTDIPAQQGFAEWQAARDAARREYLNAEMGAALPQNKGNSTNVLRPWTAFRGGAAAGVGVGAYLGGLPGAVIGGAVGGIGSTALTSPALYRTALQGAALVGKVPAAVYRVGTATAAGASGSALADAYMRQQVAR